uniref:Ovule protein n=1 Tax=Schistosoma mansoni TaxID=6183 RepID=A0A5K4F4N3_SCHMA
MREMNKSVVWTRKSSHHHHHHNKKTNEVLIFPYPYMCSDAFQVTPKSKPNKYSCSLFVSSPFVFPLAFMHFYLLVYQSVNLTLSRKCLPYVDIDLVFLNSWLLVQLQPTTFVYCQHILTFSHFYFICNSPYGIQ